ncbi:alpha-glucosidase family protein [Colwellia sp. E2M01]|uniref:alpha-glucosidase family protein n=1 Tax=Colwellia sp. E2M01 TaxID=2841561 RepID=UPI001C08FE2B|nr:alpha-glucosidase family protein [Colwellia sp. E2M01]MBU2870759.1 alpha-glucosidase family protein [Colwellia sp. E2M01]
MNNQMWWRGAVIYQIYPRSFYDANQDGIGDLPGIISKLDYIASLGVDAIWISPFFKSPMKDFGYDISDYRDIDPIFGTLADFDELVIKAHALGIKIMIDQVLSHTSDQHQWFLDSREDQTNDKADWYVWADAKADGTAPNNWLSIFGGTGWTWEPRRQQYYLHNFLTSQPDLNFHNPDVRKAVLDNVEFWLKRGVDGFRLDAINFCFHDAQLRDNPAKAKELRTSIGFDEKNPYAYQYHYFNNTQDENLGFMEEIRNLLNQYPGAVALGEISSEDSLKTMAEYTQGDERLHMGYSFDLLTDNFSASYIKQVVQTLESRVSDGWPCWAISNHDVKRVASRWGGYESKCFTKMLFAMISSLRGSICSYQGEELGLTEADIAYEDIQDPYGITFWPQFKGRDGCRTPHPWQHNEENAGFTEGKPWLPVSKDHYAKSVDVQDEISDSVLNSYRHFNRWRKDQPTLRYGDIEFVEVQDPILAFVREYEGEKLLVCFNFSEQAQTIAVSELTKNAENLTEVVGHKLTSGSIVGGNLQLPAFGCFYSKL